MGSLFSNGCVLLKKLLVDLHIGLSNDCVVGDRWKMTDVRERPLDGQKEGLVESIVVLQEDELHVEFCRCCCLTRLDDLDVDLEER